MELYALRYGSSLFPRRLAFADDASDERLPIAWSLYALKLDGRRIVIDTGFSDPATARAWGVTIHEDPLAMLTRIGMAPAEVDEVIVTHHHVDHIDNLPAFPRARVTIARAEIAAYAASAQGGGAAVLRVLEDATRTVPLSADAVLADGRVRIEIVGG